MGLTQKYFGDQDQDRHGSILTWPGTEDGFPLLGECHDDFRQEEYEAIGLVASFKCAVFRTWVAEELAEYARVQDYIANGQFREKRRAEVDDAEHGGWRILLEWTQIYGQPPRRTGGFQAVPGDAP